MSTQTVTFKISDSKIFADVIDNQKELVEALIGLIDFADAYGSVESQNAVNKARASIDKALSPHKGEAQREHEPHARDAITWTPDTGYVFSQPKEPEQEPVADVVSGKIFDQFVALNESNAARVLELDEICQDLQEKTYNQAMRIAELEAQLAQPEQSALDATFQYAAETVFMQAKRIAELEAKLAQPAVAEQHKQEPVAWMQDTTCGLYVIDHPDEWHCIPLYTTPPQHSAIARKPLTAMEVYDVVHDAGLDWHKGFELGEDENRFVVFARAIEAAHGVKE